MKEILKEILLELKKEFVRLGKVAAAYFDAPKVTKILSYVLTVVLTMTLTAMCFIPAVSTASSGQGKLSQLAQLIDDRFIDEVDLTKLEDAAAHAMIGAMGDRWSYYIPASEMQAYEEQKNNAYVGIGITITQLEDETGLNVVQVTAGGSAEEAGILAGDVVTGVDGQSIAGMELEAIKNMIRGEEGTQVALTVLRDGTEQTIAVTRKQIKTPVAIPTLLENGIGYVKIVNFNAGCASQTITAIEDLMEQGAEKLIFDVRFNGGGYASELVDLLDYLLPEGDLFRTVDYTGKEEVEKSDAKHLDLPMAVLVNGSSYSAAEFFAAALSEYEAATIVGEQTSGKGYFQVTYQMSDGSAVSLSIGKYYTPKGNSLEKIGITPDAVVPVDEETEDAIYAGTLEPMEDPQILSAIQVLTSQE